MKPLKITMTAFGPYKDTEVIDFSELKNHRLFVISGNTGAGKTTIFDAICFALYGSASGEDRSDAKYMRSDFADDEIHTAVELEFELHNRIYRIKRQLPHVKIGNKSATGEQYEFYEKVNGQEIPCVDRQIVSEINKKVEGLVGLTRDQFSQIVMLPQGEFRKLLTSQTENKEEILRKIFKTEPYRWISERLREKKKASELAFTREIETRNRHFDSIKAILPEREKSKLFQFLAQEHFNSNQIIAGLEEESLYYKNEISKNKKQEEETNKVYHLKLEEFHKAELVNAEFNKLEEKQQALRELTEQIPLFKDKKKQLEKAERASKIESYETQVNEWRIDESAKKNKLMTAVEASNQAVLELEKAQNVFEMEEGKKSEREEVAKQLDRYQDFLPIVKEIENKKLELTKKQIEVEKLSKNQEMLENKIKGEKEAKQELQQKIKELENSVEQLADKQQNLLAMRERVRILQDYLKLAQDYTALTTEAKLKEAVYHSSKKQYEQLEEAWVNGQASILAAHLHDGKPCPVCGSSEHPLKASSQGTVPTRTELDAVKKQVDEKDDAYRIIIAKINSNQEQLEEKAKELSSIGIQNDEAQSAYNQLVVEGKQLNKEVTLLEKEKEKLNKLKEDLDKREKELEQNVQKLETIRKTYQELYTDFQTNKAVFAEKIGRIPEEIRTLTVLEQKTAEANARKLKLEEAWKTAQIKLQSAKEMETKASTNVSNAKNQLEESTTKKNRAEAQFMEALLQADFSNEDEYRQAKMIENSRHHLQEEINQFNQAITTLQAQVQELSEALQDKQKIDMEQLTAELKERKKALDAAQEGLRQSEQYLQKVIELSSNIRESEEKVAEAEKQLSIVADLFDVIRGQNSRKISFERYLQIEYLEQIIIAANERLKRLSNGQFMLMRSERQESRGKQSGLGLDVYDAYTGQTRDVKTLSGGEKFNASLCLALGMADVIQSFQGGVSIDTMFIDEGFGSLDEESLNKAIDTLIDLQKSGRMIGVISHVQELKNTMPAIIEVKKTKEGYSQTRIIAK